MTCSHKTARENWLARKSFYFAAYSLKRRLGDRVYVHYVGTLLSGEKFDASSASRLPRDTNSILNFPSPADRNQPFDFVLGQVSSLARAETEALG